MAIDPKDKGETHALHPPSGRCAGRGLPARTRHRDAFRRIERVKARQMRFDSEADAAAAADRLARGEPFAQLARQLSNAPTRAQGGALGWITAEEAAAGDWLRQFAFALPPGTPSRPVREPGDAQGRAGWQIVLVAQRVQGYHPADSETVRYVAAQAIARKQALADYLALRRQRVAVVKIELDEAALGFTRAQLKLE